MSDVLNKKHALVTGASSGIGREFCRQLAQLGYNVIAVARRESNLRDLLEELPAGQHRFLVADLATEEGVHSIAQVFDAERINLLVNNAGHSLLKAFYESELKQQQDILAVNCSAVVSLSHAFLRNSERGDALINLASIVSFLPTPAQPMYSASKSFISAFSECLWCEHKERDVYVMGLCPGVTETEFILTATGGESDGQTLPAMMTQTVEEVVADALKALKKRKKAIVITGWFNKAMTLMPRVLSRHRLIKVLEVIGDPDRAL